MMNPLRWLLKFADKRGKELEHELVLLRQDRDYWRQSASESDLQVQEAHARLTELTQQLAEVEDARDMAMNNERFVREVKAFHHADHESQRVRDTEELLTEALAMLMWYQEIDAWMHEDAE